MAVCSFAISASTVIIREMRDGHVYAVMIPPPRAQYNVYDTIHSRTNKLEIDLISLHWRQELEGREGEGLYIHFAMYRLDFFYSI